MIKINLAHKRERKRTDLPSFFGINLNTINIKAIAFAIAVVYVVDWGLPFLWKFRTEKVQAEIEILRGNLQISKEDLKNLENADRQLASYNSKVEQLQKESSEMESLLSRKSNPKRLLERVARSMPDDLWFTAIEIRPDKTLELEGKSLSYGSIGKFILAINESPFLNKSMKLLHSETLVDKEGMREIRVEKFNVEGQIKTFNQAGN